jgi:hypothetical protein
VRHAVTEIDMVNLQAGVARNQAPNDFVTQTA